MLERCSSQVPQLQYFIMAVESHKTDGDIDDIYNVKPQSTSKQEQQQYYITHNEQ